MQRSEVVTPIPAEQELEMAVEEVTGKPFPGEPEDRLEALKKRVRHLESEVNLLTRGDLTPYDEDELKRLRDELDEAKKQQAEWQAQHESRN